ncbi:hypothetical protein EDEG_01357 [Edhazardia aedis USNM 41457]|uniref:40S ribosomal protein S30 n=1 Tax=Edhazardia aedis (strain USNM 41457) TaxID=1003232 RepID=J9DA69_EDHAE|nr:hypothetical protein EDEG_01357 [Edhazardia aedis USNM 41457]|eukprot:EJW04409.1 hypothetical protein EDEG_01357 [Edhazardia aedis USNM 41457]
MAKAVTLNRAGKVRKQTPKVEKADKRPPKTGRGRKREKYEKRLALGLFEFKKVKFNEQTL